jgi:uncharacterized damage-inducible protein DinB
MDPRVASLADILRLNTKLFRNCLDGLTDEVARRRPSPTTNSAAFVAAHVADSRYFLLRIVGTDRPSPLRRYLEGAKTIDDVKELPTLAEVQEAWTAASHALREALDGLSAEALGGPAKVRFPAADQTMLGALTFLVQHDSYHVGQLSLLRRYAGLPAMKYT